MSETQDLPFDEETQQVEQAEEIITLPDHVLQPLQVAEVPLSDIQLLQNVRSEIGASMKGLAENIRVRGLLHPIVVRPAQDLAHGKPYELIVGYRRLKAFEELGRTEIPANIHAATDEDLLAELISENLQREGHSPLDEATVMQRMIDTFDWSHAQVAAQLGVDRSQVTKRLGLLKLPEKVQTMVAEGQLTASHAEVVARLDSEESQVELAELAVKKETPVSKLNAYASKIKERDEQKIEDEDEEAKPDDAAKPLDTINDEMVVDLPSMNVKEQLTEHQLAQSNLYILLRSANDEEMLSVLQELYGVPWLGLWDWVAELSEQQVSEMTETMIRRWLGAAHRLTTLPPALQASLGDGMGTMLGRPAPQLPSDIAQDAGDEEDWDEEEWDDEDDRGE